MEFQQRETMQSDRIENEKTHESAEKSILIAKQYKMGFFECLTETMQYLVEGHGYPPGHGLCLSLINHLRNHCAQIIKGISNESKPIKLCGYCGGDAKMVSLDLKITDS